MIEDDDCALESIVLVNPTGDDMDTIVLSTVPDDGKFFVYATSVTGPVLGAYNFSYRVAAAA